MQEGQLLMTQADRDRLVTLQKTRKRLITQGEAAGEWDLSLRQVQRLLARFVRHDSTEENMRLLWSYLEKHGRPLAFYTGKASLFQTAEKHKRDEPGVEKDPVEMPVTQIGRALRELGIAW
jgi:hypothetical protein